MRKRLLLWAGVATILGALVTKNRAAQRSSRPLHIRRWLVHPFRRRQGPRHPHPFIAIHWLILLLLGWPWDPIIDFASGVSNAVKDLVRSAVNAVYTYVTESFNFLYALVDTVRQTGQLVWTNLYNFANDIVEGLKTLAWSWVVFVYHLLDDAIRNLRTYVEDLVGAIYRNISLIASSLIDSINRVRQWIFDNWIAPLQNAFWNILKWVGTQIDAAVQWINTHLIQPVLDIARAAYETVAILYEWFVRTARNAVEMVLKAAWFLVLVASYGPDYWISWVTEQVNRLPSTIIGIAENAMSKEGGKIERWVVRWLGI